MQNKIKEFKLGFSENYLKYIIYEKEKEVHLDICNIDFTHVKAFFIILKQSVDYFLQEKYETFLQYIPSTDFELLDKTKWKIREEIKDENILHIECKLEDAVFNIAHGLGFKDIKIE